MEERPDQNGNYKCSDCGETFAKAIDLEWHKDKSAVCRLIRQGTEYCSKFVPTNLSHKVRLLRMLL
jgi:DNA-directed RNA polymerase subunit RPC12/RpoP